MKSRKIFAILMATMMVAVFMPTMAFADSAGSWSWAEDYSTATYTYGSDAVTVNSKATEYDATCETDAYTVYTVTVKKYGVTDSRTVVDEDTATGHTWEVTNTELSSNGKKITATFTCSECNATTTVSDYWTSDTRTEATCLKPSGHTYVGTVKLDGNSYEVSVKVDGKDPAHTLTHVEAVDATCESDGNYEYWYCPTDEKFFMENEDGEKYEVEEADTVIEATGHDYELVYEWSDNGSECIATATCQNCGATTSEAGTITSEVTTKATCVTKGKTTYTATFENELFETQTKTISDVDLDADNHEAEAEYSWSSDYTQCRANFKCECGVTEIEDATVTSETKDGITTYTATFKSELFETQVKKVENANPITAKGSTVKANAKKKTVIKKAITVSDAEGTVSYAKVSGNKKIKVNAKTGKITVKKGLKKGKTYKVKVKVTAAGNDNYVAGTKTVTVKVKVK